MNIILKEYHLMNSTVKNYLTIIMNSIMDNHQLKKKHIFI